MRIPLSWLEEYINHKLSIDALANIMTLSGLEVDSVKETPFLFDKVIVGEIKEIQPHPNADKLKIAKVFDGKENVQVICGDPSCSPGMKTAFAQVGATLKSGEKSIKIKRSKLRDIESFGMLCSEKELGLSDNHSSIMTLDPSNIPGTDLKKIFGDIIFEVSLTPNLGHCMSILGIARDLAALLDQEVLPPNFEKIEAKEKCDLKVNILDPSTCYRYSCRIIKNVKVGPSPNWIKTRLENAGIRSVNNIVDVTNYVMLELGQPIHAFDLKTINKQKINIKPTTKETQFKTLDGIDRLIPKGVLMVYDEITPIAVAGVMGGAHSEVKSDTTDILLESAHFDPSFVRKGSKKLGIRTEASARFERGVDHEMVTKALDRATYFIDGQTVTNITDIISAPQREKVIEIRTDRVNQILGTHISQNEVESFLNRLEMKTKQKKDSIQVHIPSYRNDILQEIDLIEEVARVFGYNNIQKRKARVVNSQLPHSPIFVLENQIRHQLIQSKLQEFVTCDLISPDLTKLSFEPSVENLEEIHVLQPSSVDQSILRTSILPGMLQAIKHNFDRKTYDISAFEIGRIHFKEGKNFKERSTAAILLTGKSRPGHFNSKAKFVDFFDLKGIVENILQTFNILNAKFKPSKLASFHPGKQAGIYVNDVELGVIGEMHPARLRYLDIEQRVFCAQLDLHDLTELKGVNKQMVALPQFPGSERDWTVTIKNELHIGKIFESIETIPSKFLKESSLIDLYQNETLGKDKKNVTFRFLYRNDRQTIEQTQVEKEHNRIISEIKKTFRDFIIA